MKAEELRKKKDGDLQQQVLDLKREQFNLRFQKANGELANTARFRQVKKEIARIKTVQTEQRAAVKEKK